VDSAPPPGVADERWVDSPYAPHHPYGYTVRGGTQVGYVYGKRLDVLALGGAVAVGHRWDRLTVEAEYSYLGFSELGPSSLGLGHAHRYGVTVRAEPIRFGSRIAGANSMLALYAEPVLFWPRPEGWASAPGHLWAIDLFNHGFH